MKKFISLLAIFALLFSLAACGGAGTPADTTTTGSADTDAPKPELGENDIVVSPDGDDSAAGTLEAPLASISAAKEKVKSAPEGAEVTVWLRGGRYQMAETLVFDDNDRDGVTYSAYGDEKPVLSFGTPVTGWKEGEINGVAAWVADVAEGSDFGVLSNDTEMLPRARYPKEGYFSVKWYDMDDVKNEESGNGQHTKSFIAFKDNILDFYDVESVDLIAPYNWNVGSQPLESVDPETGRVVMQGRTWNLPLEPEREFYFENVREAVCEPGEWYLDRAEHKVYYIPRESEKMADTVLYAGKCRDIVKMENVDGITFRGITFKDSDVDDWIGSYGSSCVENPAAFTINNTSGIGFESCKFTCIGRTALRYRHSNHDGVVNNCVFSQIGMCALLVNGDLLPIDDPAVTSNFTVTNNLVEYYGRTCAAGVGIALMYVNTADISNNEVHDGYYNGIQAGFTSEHDPNPTQYISIKDNLIYHIGYYTLSDMGGIYVEGEQEGTVISGNVVNGVKQSELKGSYGGNGIYLDQGSSFITVEKNLVNDCSAHAITVNGTCDTVVIRNNIVANSDVVFGCGTKFAPWDHSMETYGNIFTTNGRTIYHVENNEYDGDNYSFDEHDNFYFDYSGKSEDEYSFPAFVKGQTIVDPLFKDCASGDFTLSEDSPVVAAGFEIWDYSEAGRK